MSSFILKRRARGGPHPNQQQTKTLKRILRPSETGSMGTEEKKRDLPFQWGFWLGFWGLILTDAQVWRPWVMTQSSTAALWRSPKSGRALARAGARQKASPQNPSLQLPEPRPIGAAAPAK